MIATLRVLKIGTRPGAADTVTGLTRVSRPGVPETTGGLGHTILRVNHTREWIWSGLAQFLPVGYVTFALSFVFSHGVCCADDANDAVAAKNLATVG